MDDWHHHLHGQPIVTLSHKPHGLKVEYNGSWTEALAYEACTLYYREFGRNPTKMEVSHKVYRDLTRTAAMRFSPNPSGGFQVLEYLGMRVETIYSVNDPTDFLILSELR